jgi:hypothetical protein
MQIRGHGLHTPIPHLLNNTSFTARFQPLTLIRCKDQLKFGIHAKKTTKKN